MDDDVRLGDGEIARAILEGVAQGILDIWWLLLIMLVLALALGALNNWSRRVEARARARRRERERAERGLRRR